MIGKARTIGYRPRLRKQRRPVQKQQTRLLALGMLAPALKTRTAVDARGQARIVKAVQRFLVLGQITAGTGFQLGQFSQQLPVVGKEGRPAVKLARDQRLTNENLPRQYRVERPIVDPARRNDRQAVQGDPLGSRDLCAALFPMRLGITALEQMPSQTFYPFRFDAGHAARIQAGGFDQFRRHHPARALFEQPGTGKQKKMAPVRTQIGMLLLLQPQMTEQAGE